MRPQKSTLLTLCAILFFTGGFFAQNQKPQQQDWVSMMDDPSVNFYTVQQEFNNYWSTRNPQEKGKGWKAFKRWEYFMEPRVFPTGDRTQVLNAMGQYQQYLQQQQQQQQGPGPNPPNVQAGAWTLIGPTTTVPAGGGAGRCNFLRLDPTNANTLYTGSPGGGLWKSTNGGGSWTMWNTDALTVIGVTDLAIHPTNNQIMYLATGDGEAGDTYSIGVLKSIDGGVTWNTTGLNWVVTQGRLISKLLIDPGNPSIIHAATSNGMYRSIDAGVTFTQVQAGNFKDIEFMPGTTSTVYAVTTTGFYRSTNSGANYTNITTGLPVAGVNRFAMAVTAANNQYIYLLAGSSANSGFFGFYRSTNGGTSFTQITVSSPANILGWNAAGNDTGGQSWYDLSLAASPTNANECVAGGVNTWRTTNGGSSWTLNSHWTGSGAPYVHADCHDLVYINATTVYACTDGGVFRTTNNGPNYTDLSAGLQIAQMYRLSTSATNANMNLSGWQDNGTNRVSTGTWAEVLGGDGMECIIDYTTTNNQYGELYYGAVYRTTNNWAGATQIVGTGGAGVNANGNWVTPYIMHPTTNTTLIIGKAGLYRSTNSGTNWSALGGTTGGTGNIVGICYAPSNTNYIYAIKQNAVFRSSNGGTSFTNVTGTLPTTNAMTYICTSTTDPLRVYVTYSGYNAANKVYMSTDGGATWTNYSTGLPNLPVNCIVYQNSTPDGVYIGTDVGCYYRDNTQPSWISFSTGMPNVVVNELEIQYAAGKIRAATYGRGMWESTLFSSGSSAPVANFTSNLTSGCPGVCIQFTDISVFNPTSWSWSFPGGTPATSTAQNPLICYNTPGVYQVTLTATNLNGNDSEVKTGYITITAAGPLPLVEGFENVTFPPANWIPLDANQDNIFWARTTACSGYNTSTACMWFDNYTLNAAGSRDEMWSPKYIFSSLTSATMTFDVAYARYDATYSDTLAVLISTNCGATWTQIYLKGGTTLSTSPDLTTAFTPTGAQWRTETINLNAYCGQPTVMVSFQNRGRWGNNLYVDNINITGVTGAAPTAIITTSANTICANGCVNFTDGSTGSPTSWAWTFPSGTPATSTVQNPGSVCWTTPGTYTVTLTATNSNGASTTTSSIVVNANPVVSVTAVTNPICSGNNTVVNATGGTTYTWAPATGLSATTGASVTATPSVTTTYTVTGTTNGCTGSSTIIITVNPSPTVTVTPVTNPICSGGNTVINATGATTYTWAPATSLSATIGASVTANPTATITYTVTGTSGGCTRTATVTITVLPPPTTSVSASPTGVCIGNSSTLTATGATTYTWAPATGLSATTGAVVTSTPTATITYTVTGANGSCTNTATVTVTLYQTPIPIVTPSAPTICSGNNVSLTCANGQSWVWSPATGLSATTGNTVIASPTVTTTYTVVATGATGCTSATTVVVTVNPLPNVTATAVSPTVCTNGNTVINATGATAYTWSPATGLSATTGASVTSTPTATITYTVTGTSNGCTNTATVTITVLPPPTTTVSASPTGVCIGNSSTLTATGATLYTWTPATGLSATTGAVVTSTPTATTTYTVTGMNGSCSSTATVTVTLYQTPIPIVTPSAPTICIGGNVSMTCANGQSWVWSPATGLSATTGNTVVASPTVTTTYTVVATGATGCTSATTVVVTVNTPAVPTITQLGNVLTCNPAYTTYQWYLNSTLIPGATNQNYTITQAGSYTVEVTNASGCTATSSAFNAVLTGMIELTVDEFNIFPNPNNGVFDVLLNVKMLDNYILEITNEIGQVIMKEELKNFSGSLSKPCDLRVQGAGTYFITLRNSANQTIRKIIVF